MLCYDPPEQSFDLEDRMIGIDWGKNGDKAMQVTMKKEKDGTYTLTEIKELTKL